MKTSLIVARRSGGLRHLAGKVFVALACSLLGPAVLAQQPVTASGEEVAESTEGGKVSEGTADLLRQWQAESFEDNRVLFGHWGASTEKYSTWTNHSNRLIPLYTFGMTLDALRGQDSIYRNRDRIESLYGSLPEGTLNPTADYLDQTDVYRLQQQAIQEGKKRVILMVFDGLDWDVTRAAAIYRTRQVGYDQGRGSGLAWQDYDGATTDFGSMVTSPMFGKLKTDVNAQVVLGGDQPTTGGYDARMGGESPWVPARARDYLLGIDRTRRHSVTDSASSATSMTSGIKTYNGSINIAADGTQVEPIGRQLQRERGFAVGVVSSVPVSHATPAAAYANNVTRSDYQDLSRDLLGVRSVAHRAEPLPGVDVLIGCGWGQTADSNASQGNNYASGNRYIHEADMEAVAERDAVVVQRTPGQPGEQVLRRGVQEAVEKGRRLVGLFGVNGGHLPYRTADGNYDPAADVNGREKYDQADVRENPTLAEMSVAALEVLSEDEEGFWLMVEAGDVDWASHANNLDNAIGAVFSGEEAFSAVVDWIEAHGGWDETALILTADHGHYFNLTDPKKLALSAAK